MYDIETFDEAILVLWVEYWWKGELHVNVVHGRVFKSWVGHTGVVQEAGVVMVSFDVTVVMATE